VGTFLGSLIAGWVAAEYGWRYAFYALGIPGIFVAVLVYALLKEPRRGLVDNEPKTMAPVPNFGGNTTVAGRFTNQVVVDQNGTTIFKNPEPGTTGNTSYRWVEGPGNIRVDAALAKKIQIDESRSITVRADAVNVMNHAVWGNPNTDINSNGFGRITTATGSRTITLSARVDF